MVHIRDESETRFFSLLSDILLHLYAFIADMQNNY